MFPDGGYAVNDDYGEISHWEPFQQAYLEWIKESYSSPWSDEARQHIAFLMGLGSHGLADQSFDAMYFRRAYQYDADGNWSESLDTATDVAFIAETGAQPIPEKWIPMEAMLDIYGEQNYAVSADTISQGQSLLGVAIFWVGNAAEDEEILTEQRSYYPWATANLLQEQYPGSPPTEVDIIAAYWQVLWAQLHDDEITAPVMYAYPPADTFNYPRDKEDIESHLSVVFAKGIETSSLSEEVFSVEAADGLAHPIGVDVFYGANSHVVNIVPLEDWKEDTDYQLIVTKDLPFRDGTTLDMDWSHSFSTKKEVLPAPNHREKRGCQATQSRRLLPLIMLGLSIAGLRRRYD